MATPRFSAEASLYKSGRHYSHQRLRGLRSLRFLIWKAPKSRRVSGKRNFALPLSRDDEFNEDNRRDWEA